MRRTKVRAPDRVHHGPLIAGSLWRGHNRVSNTCRDQFQIPLTLCLFFSIPALALKGKKKKRLHADDEGSGARPSGGAAQGVKKWKKDFERESEKDRFNRLSRNLQIMLEDENLNVPKICSTLVRREADSPQQTSDGLMFFPPHYFPHFVGEAL